MGGRHTAGGFTLTETVVTVALLGTLAAIVAPGLAHSHSVAAGSAAARRLALVLRSAQTRAQADETRVCVVLTGDGGYVVTEVRDGSPVSLDRGDLEARPCTNYPADEVDFCPSGWPVAAGSSVPRAGAISFAAGARRISVVVQLTGRVRVR
jgi:prepilin-type N-terminal cleavage/methylation domain-containing protein